MTQVFVSHTKKDKDFCNEFDNVCAREGIKAFRSEFENITNPPWKTITNAINDSAAIFFLIGKELVKNQRKGGDEWNYTQNWIAFEIGVACQKGIDVWAICDDVAINFPMPYINNYLTVGLKHNTSFNYLRGILEDYKKGNSFSYPYKTNGVSKRNYSTKCPYDHCNMEFNLHVQLSSKEQIICPQCLGVMEYPKGHP